MSELTDQQAQAVRGGWPERVRSMASSKLGIALADLGFVSWDFETYNAADWLVGGGGTATSSLVTTGGVVTLAGKSLRTPATLAKGADKFFAYSRCAAPNPTLTIQFNMGGFSNDSTPYTQSVNIGVLGPSIDGGLGTNVQLFTDADFTTGLHVDSGSAWNASGYNDLFMWVDATNLYGQYGFGGAPFSVALSDPKYPFTNANFCPGIVGGGSGGGIGLAIDRLAFAFPGAGA